jgi:hypothetical protein
MTTFLTVLPDYKAVNASIAPLSKLYTFPTMGGVTDSSAHTEQSSVPLKQALQSPNPLDKSLVFSVKKRLKPPNT